RLPELQPGRYVIMALPRNGAQNMNLTPAAEPLPANPEVTYAGTYYPSSGDPATSVPIDVGEGGDVRNIDIRLIKARVFRVRGKLTGVPNGGRGSIPVNLTPRDGGPGRTQISTGQVRGPEGVFEIRNVPPGQYLIHAQTQVNGQQFIALSTVDVVGSHVDG